jgi:hypothetical protein
VHHILAKIMNPEKMRSEYGKLVYLMQDALNPEIMSLLGVRLPKCCFYVFTESLTHKRTS